MVLFIAGSVLEKLSLTTRTAKSALSRVVDLYANRSEGRLPAQRVVRYHSLVSC